MAFFTKSEARAAAAGARGYRTAKAVLTATMENYKSYEEFDIFLSHSTDDSDLVLGVMILLQKQVSMYLSLFPQYGLGCRPATGPQLGGQGDSCHPPRPHEALKLHDVYRH